MVSARAAFATLRSCHDFTVIAPVPASAIRKMAAAFGRPSLICIDPGNASEVKNARFGEIGRRPSESYTVLLRDGALTPTRVLSVACALVRDGIAVNATKSNTEVHKLAGECGNRTHQARLSRVTPVLKTGEATRPHPPPLSVNHNRKFAPFEYFSDLNRAFHFRKILRDPARRHGDEKPT